MSSQDWLERELGERLDVERNDDYDDGPRARVPGAASCISATGSRPTRRTLVERLLPLLWERGIPAVAACDYEDELPEKGGYKSRAVPWPS